MYMSKMLVRSRCRVWNIKLEAVSLLNSREVYKFMPKVLVADKISAAGVEILKQVADVDVNTGLEKDALINCIGEYEGLVVRSATKVTADVIAAAERLRIIGRAGVGVDNIDVPAATQRGIVVVNSPEGNTIAVAELTMALLLSMSRNIPAADASVKAGRWERGKYEGVEVYGKTIGIVGLGKIGREVAKRAQVFGMKVIACDPYMSADVAKKLGVEMKCLDDLLAASDYISFHLPKNKETEGMIGAREIERMKTGVRIINTARGGIIDEAALAEGLKSGKIAAAAVDVFSQEPITPDNPLLGVENIITTPHLGASTAEAQSKVAVDVAEQMVDFFRGLPPRASVNMPAISAEVLGRISSYLVLAERMGVLLTQTGDGRLESVTVTYSGEISSEETDPITRAVLKGIFSPMLSERVNYVNAPIIAESRGVKVTEGRSSDRGDFVSLIKIETVTENSRREVSGTVLGKSEMRIVSLDGYRIDLVPEGNMLITWHVDRPGVIGKVGTILGNSGINIGGMYVGRQVVGSNAIMVLSVDSPVPEEVVKKLEDIQGIDRVRQISFDMIA